MAHEQLGDVTSRRGSECPSELLVKAAEPTALSRDGCHREEPQGGHRGLPGLATFKDELSKPHLPITCTSPALQHFLSPEASFERHEHPGAASQSSLCAPLGPTSSQHSNCDVSQVPARCISLPLFQSNSSQAQFLPVTSEDLDRAASEFI